MINEFPKDLKTERKIRKNLFYSLNLKTFRKNIIKDKKGRINKEIRNY